MSKAQRTAASILGLFGLVLLVAFTLVVDPPESGEDACIRRGREAHKKIGAPPSDDYIRGRCKAGHSDW